MSAATVVPFHFMGRAPSGEAGWRVRMPATHDVAMHFDHLRSFWRSLASGILMPRWEEDANRGFGAPSLEFHPPGVYYVACLVHVATPDWGLTFLGTHLLVTVASGMALYLCARRRLSRGPAAVAMAAYLVMPYHLVDLYHRGALAELLAFVWMPLVLWCADGLLDPAPLAARLRWVAGFAAAYGALLWSHPPTCHQFSLSLGLYAVVQAARRRDARTLAPLAGAAALGVALSAAYFYPAFAEQDLIRGELFRSAWAYRDHYVFAARAPGDAPPAFWRLIQQSWLFATIGVVVAGTVLLRAGDGQRLSARLRDGVVAWVVTGAAVSLMMTPLAAPLERVIPGLEMTSFPWRMLSISSVLLALLIGACAEATLAWAHLAAVALVAAALVFSAGLVAGPRWGEASFQPRPSRPPAEKAWMIPVTAPGDPRTLPQMDPAALAGGHGRVTVELWEPERRRLHVDLAGSDRLQVRTFQFPGWTAKVAGHPASIETGPWGNIELSLPAGSHDVALEYDGTGPRRAGAAITGLAALILAGLLAASRRASRRARAALDPVPGPP